MPTGAGKTTVMTLPCTLLGHERKYRPDYIVKRGLGEPKPLHVVEIKGIAGEKCGVPRTMRCVLGSGPPAVNNQGGFGAMGVRVVKDIHDAKQQAPRAA